MQRWSTTILINIYSKFFTADNCSTMQKLAKITRPMIGCKCHILALSIQYYYKIYLHRMNLVLKIHRIMKILRKANNSGMLRSFTILRPKLYCPTRWSSIYDMLKRYRELHPFLEDMSTQIEEILILSPGQMNLFTRLWKDMKYFHRATLSLQKEDVTLSQCRMIYDEIMLYYPYLDKYLSRNSRIIQFKSFENGLI